MIKRHFVMCSLFLCVILSSCSVQQAPLQSALVASADPTAVYVLEKETAVKAGNAANTTLRSGTTWLLVGSIEKGNVFKTKDQVVVVNSFNVHEAYIVVQGDTVVGYYLPVEKTFVKSKPVKIILSKKGA
jgi:hypothetical protein